MEKIEKGARLEMVTDIFGITHKLATVVNVLNNTVVIENIDTRERRVVRNEDLGLPIVKSLHATLKIRQTFELEDSKQLHYSEKDILARGLALFSRTSSQR